MLPVLDITKYDSQLTENIYSFENISVLDTSDAHDKSLMNTHEPIYKIISVSLSHEQLREHYLHLLGVS